MVNVQSFVVLPMHLMDFKVKAVSREEFDGWVEDMKM